MIDEIKKEVAVTKRFKSIARGESPKIQID